jgi:hypothetical protein
VADIVTAYDLAEREALTRLPNRAIQAFGAATFASVGYPFRVHDQRELWRYIDVMHEGYMDRNLKSLGAVSGEEVRLATWLADRTFEYSNSLFQRPFTGRYCATRALLQLRGIETASKECPGKSVLELGPGSGFLSLLMAKSGYAVDTVEVAQALALHQSLFFHHFLPNSSHVLHQSNNRPPDSPPAEGWIRQIPWWTYADNSDLSYGYDLVTVNHALAEFHPASLVYLLHRFGQTHSAKFKYSPPIIAEGLGGGRTHSAVLQQMHECGWSSQAKGPFYLFKFDPVLASQQFAEDVRQQQYQKSLRRKVKRTIYLTVVERRKKHNTATETNQEDHSLQQLRQVFDRHIPNEQHPDAFYLMI